ncbi:hypothetical protein AVEN_38073-1 [Araneus ventricosus]|uniref:Uncharacterized protein n=1 Tax=Araneus ventricosus TaxID=182803 RepID=A0A4Y2PDL9_ARAVE|nr:hypothetical protein AVEN_38073-1 [Araneus ventricosus]
MPGKCRYLRPSKVAGSLCSCLISYLIIRPRTHENTNGNVHDKQIAQTSRSQNRPSSIFTRQPPECTGRTPLQRRKQQSVASPALHPSVYSSSAFDLQAAAAGKRSCGRELR